MEKNIEAKIEQSVQETWDTQKASLLGQISDVTGRINDIIQLEEHKRNGHKSEQLKKTFGSFGALTVNTENLSSILESSEVSTALNPKRLKRVIELEKSLKKATKDNDHSYQLFHFKDNGNEIIKEAEKHLNDQAEVFCALRVANLEAKAKYNPELHDDFFADFNWSHLNDDELMLCSPVIVLLDMNKTFEEQFAELLPLLSSGLPIKIIAIRNNITSRLLPESSRAAVSSSAVNVELLPVALQKVFVFQSVYGGEHFEAALKRGLNSSHPGFFSIYYPDEDNIDRVVSSRAFPYFIYDPLSSSDFVTRIDISENPQLESLWVKTKIRFLGPDGEETSMEVEETYADLLLSKSDADDEFTPLETNGSATDHIIPLASYLLLSSEERLGKVPVVYRLTKEKSLESLVPSRNVILNTADKKNSWQALRELTGIDNPLILKTQKSIKQKLTTEKETAINNMQTQMELTIKTRESDAVTKAIQNLSLQLFGMAGTAEVANQVTPVSSPLTTIAADESTPVAGETVVETISEEVEDEISELPWIETELCTTCDECTDINSKLFAYDDKKLAYIKDPKGGSFKDIVKAAELCPSHIIHPGMPQFPDEKNLDKLIVQAEPYQ